MPSQQQAGQTQAGPKTEPLHRLGPQPLPLHLGLALTTWSNSATVLPSLMLAWQHLKAQEAKARDLKAQAAGATASSGSQAASGAAAGQAQRTGTQQQAAYPMLPERLAQALRLLGPQLDAADPAGLAKALSDEGLRRLDAFVTGTLAYRRQPAIPRPAPHRTAWSSGTTRLLDYSRPGAAATAPRILVIPSLINRYYILDLAPGASFLDFLADAGCRPYVVDWDAPGPQERDFSLSDYIAGRLRDAYHAVQAEPGGPIFVIGYCMGGLLALALAQLLSTTTRKSSQVSSPAPAGLVLLATPWDFHAEQADQAAMIAAIGRQLEPIMAALGELPVDLLQSFFALLDPFQVPRKFQAFARLSSSQPQDPGAVRRFTLLEDWLNDGITLAAPVARECLINWYGENSAMNGNWRVGGNIITPQKIGTASLALIPDRDRIVPPGSALALAQALPLCDIDRPPAGHIGMMAGSKAGSHVWPRIRSWIEQQSRGL